MSNKHAISWFEIPTKDLDRAQKFYESIFDFKMIPMDVAELKMRMFPVNSMNEDSVSGALVFNEEFYNIAPNTGVLIYLNGNPDLQGILDKVESAGGKVLVPKTQISPEHGFMGIFEDSEGNRIGLHGNK